MSITNKRPRKGIVFFTHTIFFSIRQIHIILIQNSNISIGPLINIDNPMLVQRRKKLNIFFSLIHLKYFKRVINIIVLNNKSIESVFAI